DGEVGHGMPRAPSAAEEDVFHPISICRRMQSLRGGERKRRGGIFPPRRLRVMGVSFYASSCVGSFCRERQKTPSSKCRRAFCPLCTMRQSKTSRTASRSSSKRRVSSIV